MLQIPCPILLLIICIGYGIPAEYAYVVENHNICTRHNIIIM